jgi:hypothetical protein
LSHVKRAFCGLLLALMPAAPFETGGLSEFMLGGFMLAGVVQARVCVLKIRIALSRRRLQLEVGGYTHVVGGA